MLLPYGHEDLRARRWPLVTLGLIAVNVVAFVASCTIEHSLERFGYLPARPRAWQLLTSMFVHADVFHLLGNVWFLWLAAVSLEDRWGRPVFLLFYLVSGVVAAVAFGLTTSDPTVPLIGASGAIAGVMGAFLVLFAQTRIRFVYFYYRVGRFSAPAYLMLPLWLAEQVFDAVLYRDSDGIAYGAHLGGFAFGALVAVGLKYSGLDARLDRGVERTVSIDLDPRVERAELFQQQGRNDEARALARDVIAEEDRRQRPGSNDVIGALRVLYAIDRDQASYERFVRLLSTDDLTLDEAARVTAARLRDLGDDVIQPLPTPLRIRLAKRLDKLGDATAALRVRP